MSVKGSKRRLEQPREQMLAAALELISEQGLAGMTMAALGARLGTSGGHLLYYFGSKDLLLLETLRWSEDSYTRQRRELAARPPTAETLLGFAALFLPIRRADERWLLWLELWARSPYDTNLAGWQRELDSCWREDLIGMLTAGVSAGVFADVDITGWADRFLSMLDGFSISIVTGAPLSRDQALEHAEAVISTIET